MKIKSGIKIGILIGGMLLLPAGARAADLSQANVFPNPVRVYLGDSEVVFDNVAGGNIKIYDARSAIIKEISLNGSPFGRWDLTNQDGHRVGSGVYFYVITADDQTKTGKLAIIR